MQLLFTHDDTAYGNYYLSELHRAFKKTPLHTAPVMPFVVSAGQQRVLKNLPPSTRVAIVEVADTFQVAVKVDESSPSVSYITCPLPCGPDRAFNAFRAVMRFLQKEQWKSADVVIVPPLGGVSHTLAHELHRAFTSVVPIVWATRK